VFVCVARAAARTLARRSAAYIQNTVIVGAGDVGQLLAKKFLNHPEYGMNLVGFVDAKPKERPRDLENVALLGDTGRLAAIVRYLDVERVVVAPLCARCDRGGQVVESAVVSTVRLRRPTQPARKSGDRRDREEPTLAIIQQASQCEY
jgi:FlaA1/EpsC-like NDP-sugar epimerase